MVISSGTKKAKSQLITNKTNNCGGVKKQGLSSTIGIQSYVNNANYRNRTNYCCANQQSTCGVTGPNINQVQRIGYRATIGGIGS